MISRRISSQTRSRGFTLIEVTLAIGLIAMLIVMCTAVAHNSLMLSSTINKKQAESTVREGFFEMLHHHLGALPGNTRMEITSTKGGAPYYYTITLQNVPLAFTWGGTERIAKAVQIVGVPRRDGLQNIVMKYYENEILTDSDTVANAVQEKPFAEIVMLEEVGFFEWFALDGRTMEWSEEWDLQGRLPLQLELKMNYGGNGEEIRQVFWIVPKVNPELRMRNLGQNQGGQGGGDGGGEGGGDGGGGGNGGPPNGGGGQGGGPNAPINITPPR